MIYIIYKNVYVSMCIDNFAAKFFRNRNENNH